MDIPIKAKVYGTDGTCGESTFVILNPITEIITHVVVQEKHYPHVERMVPINHIRESTSDSIKLDCSTEAFSKMEPFFEHHFIRTKKQYDEYSSSQVVFWPYVHPMEIGYIDIRSEHIPPGELAIHRGAKVKAIDGRVGSVDEFLIDPSNGDVSHVILREGHIWDKKDVSIPVAQVDHISNNTIYVKLDKNSIEALPEIPIKRSY